MTSDDDAQRPPSLRLVFMGAPDFAARQLDALAAAGCEVAAVYTQPARPAGRGKRPRPTAVAERAEALGLPLFTPASLKPLEEVDRLRALQADVAVVVAYGLLLPQAALDAPRLGCVNLHASLLPRWRGAAPIQRAIMAGDAETGLCAMKMTAGLDEGPVYARVATPISAEDDQLSLHDRLAALGPALLLDTLRALERGDARAEPQPAVGATYARKIDKAEGAIEWRRSAAELDATIRGLSPSPGAFALADFGGAEPERVKILAARPERGRSDAEPSVALDDALLIATGAGGALRLTRLQRAGRAAQDAESFLRGAAWPAGRRFLDKEPAL